MSERSERIHRLGTLLAHKGIPPFMLASNIMEPNYQSVHLWKDAAGIYVQTVCTDEETGHPLKFLYRYSPEQVLQRIERLMIDGPDVIWDRNEEISKLAGGISPDPQTIPRKRPGAIKAAGAGR